MRCDISLSPEAIDDLRGLKANARAVGRDAIETYLRRAPTKTSKSRPDAWLERVGELE